jgi:hypothetical protein
MSVTGASGPPDTTAYIRGGGGVLMNPRRLAGILVWICAVALVGIAAYLAVSAAQQGSRLTLLRDRGVPVDIAVTGCRGISSGVGMGIEYWQCSGSFTLEGRTYNEIINGSRKLVDPGRHVAGVVVPGRPDLLTDASAVRGAHSSGAEYTVAGALAAGGVLVGGARVRTILRRGIERPAGVPDL